MADATNGKLYTLTEVSKRTKISMPTLQRYKKMFNERIPSSGDGRSQRYPEAAIEIFNQLKVENSKKRGRPRKNAAQGAGPAASRAAAKSVKAPAKAAAAEEAAEPGMLSLKEIEDQTGISYPTLLRYLKTSLKRIPHKGSGRRRRFPQESVAVFPHPEGRKPPRPQGRLGQSRRRQAGSGRRPGRRERERRAAETLGRPPAGTGQAGPAGRPGRAGRPRTAQGPGRPPKAAAARPRRRRPSAVVVRRKIRPPSPLPPPRPMRASARS